MAAFSTVMLAIVATEPSTKRDAVTGSRPMICRLLPRLDDSATVPTARISTVRLAIAVPVETMRRLRSLSVEPSSANRRIGMPRPPMAPRKAAVEDAAAARPDISGHEQPGGQHPVGEAEHRGGSLLGHEVGKVVNRRVRSL